MKKVLVKLSQARDVISKTPIKKNGRNDFSKYDYFTPEQVHKLVEDASQSVGIIALYSIDKSELGYKGVLEIVDLETGESYKFTMATDMPEIKATNATQKLGGMATYNERYMKMSAFGIVDNNLDFDSQDNRPKKPVQSKPQEQPKQSVAKAPSDKQIAQMKAAVGKGKKADVEKYVKENFTLTPEQRKEIFG